MTTEKPQSKWWVTGLRGVLAVGFGILLILGPGETLLLLLQLFSAYLLIDGAVRLYGVYRGHFEQSRRFHLVLGIAGIITGAVVLGSHFLNITISADIVPLLGVLIGAQAVIAGLLNFRASRSMVGNRRAVSFFGGIGALALGIVTILSVLLDNTDLVPIIGIVGIAYGTIYLYIAYNTYKVSHPEAVEAVDDAA